jgi:hypothetical protein
MATRLRFRLLKRPNLFLRSYHARGFTARGSASVPVVVKQCAMPQSRGPDYGTGGIARERRDWRWWRCRHAPGQAVASGAPFPGLGPTVSVHSAQIRHQNRKVRSPRTSAAQLVGISNTPGRFGTAGPSKLPVVWANTTSTQPTRR